jgi:uncharacterized membrane protein
MTCDPNIHSTMLLAAIFPDTISLLYEVNRIRFRVLGRQLVRDLQEIYYPRPRFVLF